MIQLGIQDSEIWIYQSLIASSSIGESAAIAESVERAARAMRSSKARPINGTCTIRYLEQGGQEERTRGRMAASKS